MKRITRMVAAAVIAGGLLFAAKAHAVTYLPAPGTVIPGTDPNVVGTLASRYDDFWAYSAHLNDLLGYPGFRETTGTGLLAVKVYTGAGGASNLAYNMEDPLDAPGGNVSSFSGIWGDGRNPNGPVTVANVLTFLHTNFGTNVNVPVFMFDMNQIANEQNADGAIDLAGEVRIVDANGVVKGHWSFDAVNNNAFDPTSYVTAPGTLVIPKTDGTSYTVDNNRGSGVLDYIAIAPDMDLTKFSGSDRFIVEFNLDRLTDGFDELYLSGMYAPVPEPSTLMLAGLGIVGMALRLRRRSNHKK